MAQVGRFPSPATPVWVVLGRIRRRLGGGWDLVGSGKNSVAPELTDAGIGQKAFPKPEPVLQALAVFCFHEATAKDRVRAVDLPRGPEQAGPVLRRYVGQEVLLGSEHLQELRGGIHALCQGGSFRFRGFCGARI